MRLLLSLSLTLSLLSASAAQAADPAYLVTDINRHLAPSSSSPSRLQRIGNLVYFETEVTHELWRTDGTETGTFALAPAAYWRVELGGKLWFTQKYPDTEIWSTDGTVAGTRKFTLPPNVTAIGLMAGPTHLYFFNGKRLWRTDGTAATTVQVSSIDFSPINNDSAQWGSTILGPTLYFLATTRQFDPIALWRTDESGTSLVKESAGSHLMWPMTVGPLVYVQRFSLGIESSQVWRSDGTAAGTGPVKPALGNNYIAPVGIFKSASDIYFAGSLGNEPRKLWKSDGTDAGTAPVATSLPGASASFDATPLARLANGTMLFIGLPLAPPAQFGYRGLWAFDGANTTFLANVGDSDNYRVDIPHDGSYTIFWANGLWRSDGTVSGTYPLSDQVTAFKEAMTLNGSMIFGATDAQHGAELWKTDGTVAGTMLLKDISISTLASTPKRLRAFRGGVLMTANADDPMSGGNPQGPRTLWFSDGTDAGTKPLLANVSIDDDRVDTAIMPCGERAYFIHQTPEAGRELWATDGTAAGTGMVKDAVPGTASANPYGIACSDGRLFFLAGNTLWRTDGTPDGTLLLRDLGPINGFSLATPVAYGHAVYFGTGPSPATLWRSDGTPGGTAVLKTLPGSRAITSFRAAGDTLYFVTEDDDNQRSLWRSDGTAIGTAAILRDRGFTLRGDFYGKLVFLWEHDAFGPGLCATDSTGPGTTCFDQGGSGFELMAMNSRMYYVENSGDLRTADGFSSSFTGVKAMQYPWLTAGGRLYAGYYPTGYFSFAESDGTLAGTRVLLSRETREAVSSGGRIFLAADELYAYDPVVAAVSFAPRRVAAAGGQAVTISGRGFSAPALVRIGLSAATVTAVSATGITFLAPAHDPGTYPIDLTLGDGRRMTLEEPLTYYLPVELSAPTALQATADSATHVAVTWNASPGATQYELTRGTQVIATLSGTSYSDDAVSGGKAYVYRVRALGPDGNSPFSAADLATTVSFTDDSLIRAAHITELRAAVAAVQTAAGRTPSTWTDALTPGVTLIRAVHMLELRAALTDAFATLGLSAPAFSGPATAGTLVRGADVQELRSAMR